MQVIKKINNNVALASDACGNEMIVFGKGIGFPAVPYELNDLSRIQRTFYNINPKYYALLNELREELLLASDDIAELARDELDCELNPNLPFFLADHLSYVVERCKNGVALVTPLAYDVRHLYPQEYAIAHQGLGILRERLGVELPDSEAVSIALHIINSESENGSIHETLANVQVISEVSDMVEQYFCIKLARDGFHYSRFAAHMRYLVQRMSEGKPLAADKESMGLFQSVRQGYPEDYDCSRCICTYLKERWGWTCTQEEQLYLIMHIHRVHSGTEG